MAVVKAPFPIDGMHAGVLFKKGAGETDNEHLIKYFEWKGYLVTSPVCPLASSPLRELREYADEHGIDLGGATKRAEVLAVIMSSGKETAGLPAQQAGG
jgi:hypothetical protein